MAGDGTVSGAAKAAQEKKRLPWMLSTEACVPWKKGQCSNFPGALASGYGRIVFQGRVQQVTRLLLGWKMGRPLAETELALHSCDNKACINPEHLFSGTPLDNMLDKIKKGRDRNGRNERVDALTEKDFETIRRLLSNHEMYQEDVAKIFNISQATVSKIKLGQRNYRKKEGVLS